MFAAHTPRWHHYPPYLIRSLPEQTLEIKKRNPGREVGGEGEKESEIWLPGYSCFWVRPRLVWVSYLFGFSTFYVKLGLEQRSDWFVVGLVS
jgi:hypothetical protein